jgi:hypothetical protein
MTPVKKATKIRWNKIPTAGNLTPRCLKTSSQYGKSGDKYVSCTYKGGSILEQD